MSRISVIYNCAAGQGKAGSRLDEVCSLLDGVGIAYEIHTTERPGHGIELAQELANDGSSAAIVAAGGDGTVNEVINGLMAAKGTGPIPKGFPLFGVLCVGRGNDFAYGAGVPIDLAEAVQSLKAGHTRPLDVGWLKGGDYPDGRYFGNGIGIGFDTIVGLEAAKLKWIKGFSAYLVGTLKTLLFYYEAPPLRVVTDDGEIRQGCLQVSVMNGRRMGGAFFMAPDASVEDGLFDLCIAGTPKRGQMLGIIAKYMKGTQKSSEHIITGRTRRFVLEAEAEVLAIHADGEIISTHGKSLEAECVPQQLSIIAPPREQ